MATDQETGRGRGHNFAAVHSKLREAILTGELEPGEITTQMALADQFSVGRTPLREALRVLQNEDLVLNEPNRRVQVTPLGVEDAEELYLARILLESTAVRQTVPGFTSRDDAEMIGYLAQMDHYGEGRDWAGLRTPHRDFHARLYSGAGSRINGLVSELSDHSERYRLSNHPDREHWMKRQAEHRSIAAAAAERDADRTAKLVVEHYARTAAMVCVELDPAGNLDRLRATLRTMGPEAEAVLDDAAEDQRRARDSRPAVSSAD